MIEKSNVKCITREKLERLIKYLNKDHTKETK